MRDTMLILHFLGLAMGLGTSFASMFLGIASAKMEPEFANKFRLNALVLVKMGHIGLTLLVLSGLYLVTPYWGQLLEMPLLLTKLILVLVLGALIGMISANARRARQGEPEKCMKKIATIGRISLLTTLTIVVLAVLTFH